MLGMVQPWVNKLLIDDVLVVGDPEKLKLVCFLFLAAALLRVFFGFIRRFLFVKIGEGAVLNLRNRLFSHLQSLSLAFFNRKKTGEIMAAFTSDIAVMQGLYTSTLVDFVTDTIRLIVVLIVMFRINPELTLISLPALPVFGFLAMKLGKPIRRISEFVQEKNADVSGSLQENISGIREIKAFTRENDKEKGLNRVFKELLNARIKQVIIGSFANIATLIAWGNIVLVIWIGGLKVIHGDMQIGVLIAFMGYQVMLFGPVNTYVSLNTRIQSAMGAARRVFNLFDTVSEILDSSSAREIELSEGKICFENVSFFYNEGEKILNNVNLIIEPGEFIALVGQSGSGKTSLVFLLLRFYDPTTGKITVDGYDLKEISLASLRKQVGIVFQDSFLFDVSIRENILFAKENASEEEMIEAARAANAHEFIQKFEEGYDTVVGERGVQLSGGQKQRIAIARTLLMDPRIVILDEATSSLDSESERLVQEAMEKLLENRTGIVIAHRLSTILHCDRIIVLDEGEITETGSHIDLLKRGSVYLKLYRLQFGRSEEMNDSIPPDSPELS